MAYKISLLSLIILWNCSGHYFSNLENLNSFLQDPPLEEELKITPEQLAEQKKQMAGEIRKQIKILLVSGLNQIKIMIIQRLRKNIKYIKFLFYVILPLGVIFCAYNLIVLYFHLQV